LLLKGLLPNGVDTIGVSCKLQRNRVIHAYDSVDDILIWKIIVKDLPILLEEATKLINEN